MFSFPCYYEFLVFDEISAFLSPSSFNKYAYKTQSLSQGSLPPCGQMWQRSAKWFLLSIDQRHPGMNYRFHPELRAAQMGHGRVTEGSDAG